MFHVPWFTLPKDLFSSIVSCWNVVALVEKKPVCQDCKQLCTNALDAKQTNTTKKAISSIDKLRDDVKKHCRYNARTLQYSQLCSPEDAEEIAATFGCPINKWDVSNIQDIS
jgi:hypothetical protein